MVKKIIATAATAGIMMASALPIFASWPDNVNVAYYEGNDVKVSATSGKNTMKQKTITKTEAEEDGEDAETKSKSKQEMTVFGSYAKGSQYNVANVNVNADCNECDDDTANVAIYKDNDVKVKATSGKNYMKQKTITKTEAEDDGEDAETKSKSKQEMWVDESMAEGTQWNVSNVNVSWD